MAASSQPADDPAPAVASGRTGQQIFISCVSNEFEKSPAGSPPPPFPGLRSALRRYLAAAKCHVVVQEDFPQVAVDTVQKLADIIRDCAAVIHLVGEQAGATANAKAVAAYLKGATEFLNEHPELRTKLGDCSDLTYTQWEAFLALHYNVPLFVYATDKAVAAQKTHFARLQTGRRYPGEKRITEPADLFGQLIGDIHGIIASVPKFTRRLAPSRITRHAARELFGREAWLDALDAAWADPGVNVYTLVAWGGVGKTALVAHWVANRLPPDVERYFDWSFYSQGTGESRQTSSDLFIQKALEFFGDPDPVKGSPWERGERLAALVRQHRTLLVLDGIEPLQYPPTDRSGQAGRLKDQALEALLQSLAQDNPGLCVVTTREHLTNIEGFAAQKEEKLDRLMLAAAVSLLRHLQLVGTDEEIAAMWDTLDGHALSILQLGRLLARAYGRDLSKWRQVGFQKADKLHQGRSTNRVMAHYEGWLKSGDKEHQLELAILRLMGLFDRPMTADCFRALRQPPAIPGLTEAFQGVEEFEVEAAVTTLIENDLLSHGGEADPARPQLHLDQDIDAHPLIREYFALQLKGTHPAAFREAHSRLFDFLCQSTPQRPDTLNGLAPLYEAVTHGCLAGRQTEANHKVYDARILRGTGADGFYSTKKLGAIGADLAAVAAFFDQPWSEVSANLTGAEQAWMLSMAAHSLRALGRLTEAIQPMRAGLERVVQQQNWKNAAIGASNLSELELTLGRLPDAVADARQSITHADRSGDAFQRLTKRTRAAIALHESGQRAESGDLFAEAERIQKERQPEFGLLYSEQGFRYCDWLLVPAERAAWQAVLRSVDVKSEVPEVAGASCKEVERRAETTLRWGIDGGLSLLTIALDHLTLARVGPIRNFMANPLPQPAFSLPHVAEAVNGLRAAGQVYYLPPGLLTAALYHFVRGEHDLAVRDLAEAQQIAERGPMPLYLADVHLHRARMFKNKGELAKAAKLIRDLGYGRRYEELADAEEAAKGWPGMIP